MEIKRTVCILILISLLTVSCNWLADKKVSCKAKGYILVRNEYGKRLNVHFNINCEPQNTMIEGFSSEEFVLDSAVSKEDTVLYNWEGTTYCTIHCKNNYGYEAFSISAYDIDSLVFRQVFQPCDASKQLLIDTCENCEIVFYDTITVNRQ